MSKYIICILGILLLLAGCSGGDGSSMASKDASASDSGSVAVLLTDDPADDFNHIWIWITEISLLPADDDDDADPVVVFESDNPDGWKADLLDLRDQDAVVTVKDDIPAGHYSKIRLRVANIEVEGGEYAPCDEWEIKLPSGKIDLKPKGGFDVVPGETIAIRIDVDCNKSINLHPAGKSGKCIFRPVVFVEIDTLDAIDECPRVTKGIIETILVEDTGFTLRLGDGRGLLTVLMDEDVVVFGEDGEPVAQEDLWEVLEPGELVHVRGQLNNDGSLQASVIVIGQVEFVKGIVDTSYNVDSGLFTLDLMPPHIFTDNTVAVDVSADTLVMTGCDQPADATDIQAGMMSRVVGKVSLADQSIKAIAVLLKDLNVSGVLMSVSEPDQDGGYLLGVEVDEMETVDVYMPAGVEPTIVIPGKDPITVPIELLQTLTGCVAVSIAVESKDTSPMTASKVLVDAAVVSGFVEEITVDDDDTMTVTLGDLDNNEDKRIVTIPSALIDSSGMNIEQGAYLEVIGLNTCEGPEYYLAVEIVEIGLP